MQRLIDWYYNFLQGLLTIMLVILVLPVLLQIFSRFLQFIPRYIWTEEIARFAFIWIIMIGSSIAVRDQTHFHVDILKRLSSRREYLLRIALLMLMIIFAFVFLFGGYQFARFGSTQHSEISGLPMLAIYIAWPLAGLSWIIFIAEQIYHHFDQHQNS